MVALALIIVLLSTMGYLAATGRMPTR
jgi:hypothetical protein